MTTKQARRRVGLARGNIPFLGKDPRSDLTEVKRLGLDELLFFSIFDLSATLDHGELRELDQFAKDEGLSIGAGVGWINPCHLERAEHVSAAGDGDFLTGLERAVAAAAEIGIHDLYFIVGPDEDRFEASPAWAEQCASVTELLTRFAPVLRAHGSRLLLKTHEEITSFEIVRIVEKVGPDVIGVLLDPVNFVARLEEPVAASARVAPYVRQVHLEDFVVRYNDRGLYRVLCPFGEGVMDWPAILALAPDAKLYVDIHRAELEMPIFDPAWLAVHPELTVAEFAAVAGMAEKESARRFPTQSPPIERLWPLLERLPTRSQGVG